MLATSSWSGVQPTRLAAGATVAVALGSAGKVVAAPEVGSPVTDASADCSQLPSGMTRASSRMKRSQSNRLAATSATACSAGHGDLGEVGVAGLLTGTRLELIGLGAGRRGIALALGDRVAGQHVDDDEREQHGEHAEHDRGALAVARRRARRR